MKLSNTFSISVILLAMVALMSCAGSQSSSQSGSPPASVTEGVEKTSDIIDHRPQRDTVDWQFVDMEGQPSWTSPADREWPGEEIGVIGPIIAIGGSGSKTYVAVYDPGGIFIGAVYLKEARKDPSRLENLIQLAQARGFVQNNRTIDRVSLLRYLRLAETVRQEEMP